jgi:hypothetical protein
MDSMNRWAGKVNRLSDDSWKIPYPWGMRTIVPTVGRKKDTLSAADDRRLKQALRAIEVADARAKDARATYAALVRKLGIAACANAEGVDRRVVYERLKHWSE